MIASALVRVGPDLPVGGLALLAAACESGLPAGEEPLVPPAPPRKPPDEPDGEAEP